MLGGDGGRGARLVAHRREEPAAARAELRGLRSAHRTRQLARELHRHVAPPGLQQQRGGVAHQLSRAVRRSVHRLGNLHGLRGLGITLCRRPFAGAGTCDRAFRRPGHQRDRRRAARSEHGDEALVHPTQALHHDHLRRVVLALGRRLHGRVHDDRRAVVGLHGRHSRAQKLLVVGLLRLQRRRRTHGSAGAATDAALGGHDQVVAFHENGTRRTRLGAATAGSVAIAHHYAPARLHGQRLALKLLEKSQNVVHGYPLPLTAAWRNKIRPALHSRSAWRLDIHAKDQRGPNRCGHSGSFHKSSSPNPLLSMAKTPRSVNGKAAQSRQGKAASCGLMNPTASPPSGLTSPETIRKSPSTPTSSPQAGRRRGTRAARRRGRRPEGAPRPRRNGDPGSWKARP